MPTDLRARSKMEAALEPPGKAECAHLPGLINRFCSSCDALIIAHKRAVCAHGHIMMVVPSTVGPVVLFCAGCDDFVGTFAA